MRIGDTVKFEVFIYNGRLSKKESTHDFREGKVLAIHEDAVTIKVAGESLPYFVKKSDIQKRRDT